MNRKIIFFVLMLPFALQAQLLQVLKGNITDTIGQPMEMATIALLSKSDSSLTNFGITDSKGNFMIDEVRLGSYWLQASFIGYKTLMLAIEVQENQVQPALNQLKMKQESNVLSEIIIDGQRIPIVINKDTVSYNTEAFNVKSDESVEDLLRRLPGIEVDVNGKVLAQGQEVKKVLVDGKEFFGGNVQLVTQNLPADAIKNVKVYDRQTEDAMYTGVDDGQRTKTIDLELKEDRKKGYFGDAELAGGTDERFKAKAGVHTFSPTTRLSLLSNTNNLNQYGFGWDDMQAMAGQQESSGGSYMVFDGEGPSIPMSYDAPNNGILSSSSNGLNINYDPNKKHRLNANYFMTYYDLNRLTNTQSQEFNKVDVADFRENNTLRTIKITHMGYVDYRWEVDSFNRLEVKSSINTDNTNRRSFNEVIGTLNQNVLIQEGRLWENDLRDNLQANANLKWISKFKKEARNLTLNAQSKYNEAVQDFRYTARNRFPVSGIDEMLDLLQDDSEINNKLRATISYNEPLYKKLNMRISTKLENDLYRQRRAVGDFNFGGFIDSLSNRNNLSIQEYSGTISLNYNEETDYDESMGISLTGANYQLGLLDINTLQNTANNSWNYVLPDVYYYTSNRGKYIYINYDRNVNMPSLFQMATPINVSNPLNIFEGNTSLEPSINNNMSIYFNKYFASTQRSINFNIWSSIKENDQVLAQMIDENFRRTSQFVNVEELNYNLDISLGGRILIKKLKTFVRSGLGYELNQQHAPINEVINQRENQAWNSFIELSNSNKKVIDLTLRYSIEFNRARYSVFSELNQNFINHTLRTNVSYFINKKWTFRADFNYLYFSQEAFADALSVPLLNANLSYQPKEKSPWTFKINAFDLLNQNVVIQRTANMNFIRQTQTNLLTRYILLSVMYKFKNG